MKHFFLNFLLALECYNEKYYRGFRAKTKFLHQCIDGTCKLDSQSKGKPGCSIFSGQKWEECSVPQCSKSYDCLKIEFIINDKRMAKTKI